MSNPNKSGENRRNYPRKDIVTCVSYRVIVPSGGQAQSANISEGGLCLLLEKTLPVQTILEVKLELPGKDPVPVETFARVVWQKKIDDGYLTGVKFGAC